MFSWIELENFPHFTEPLMNNGISSLKLLKQCFMDFRLSCTSPLPWVWVIEALAHTDQVDLCLLLSKHGDFLEKMPETSDDHSRNAREMVSLRVLESLSSQGACANPVSSASGKKVRLDPSDRCEDVLQRILTETSPSHLKPAGPEMLKWDLQPFVEQKRSNLDKCTLQQVKDAIVSGSNPFFASLKEHSGLSVSNQADREAPVDDSNFNGIRPRLEGSDTNDVHFLPRDLPGDNLAAVNRKRRATSESAGGKLLENDCITNIKSVKKHKKDDNNECTSLKGLVGPTEVFPCEEEVSHCDDEPNNKSGEEKEQDHSIEEAKRDKGDFYALRRTNRDMDKFEGNKPENVRSVHEVEKHSYLSSNSNGNNNDSTDVARENNASCFSQCPYSQDPLATTNRRDQDLLPNSSKRYSEEQICMTGGKPHVEVTRQNEPPGDGNNNCISSKDLVIHDEVFLPHEEDHNCDNLVADDEFNGEKRQNRKDANAEVDRGNVFGLFTYDKDMDKLEQNFPGNVTAVGGAEQDAEVSSDGDGYHDERTNIDRKKRTFLSSQCTQSQDSLATTDWRDLNLCMKCNKGGKLLVCSSNSCPLMIHESCLGSDPSFDPKGVFYCPFCAYSRAISEYMEVKKKASLARKDLGIFFCLGSQRESSKQSQRSCREQQNHLEHGLAKNNKQNKRDVVKVVSYRQHIKKLEHKEAGPSELRSGHSPPFGGKAVDSTDRIADKLNKVKKTGKGMRQVSKSPSVPIQHHIAAQAIHKSQGENGSCQGLETVGRSEKHADTRSKKAVLCSPETDLPGQQKCSQKPQSAGTEEISEEETEDSGVSKYFVRVRKQEIKSSYPAIPQFRRKRLPWTSEEEDALKKLMREHCSPHDKIIPWKRILECGAGAFQLSRSTMDLKDKWRNMCRATSNSN